MALQQITAGITGEQAAAIIYANDQENEAAAAAGLSESDVTIEAAAELFIPANVESGKIDPSTFALVPDGLYTRSLQIVVASETEYSITGLGSIHYPTPVRFERNDGSLISGVLGIVDATNMTFTTPADTHTIRFTLKTAKTGDNTVISDVHLRQTGVLSKATEILNVPFYSRYAINWDKLTYVDNIGKNKFPLSTVRIGYVDPTTYVFTANNWYRSSGLIATGGGLPWTISGMSTAHHSLGVQFLKADGVTPCGVKGVTSPVDVPVFTFTTPADCAFFGYTFKTSKSGDTAVAAGQQAEQSATVTAFEVQKQGIGAAKDESNIEYPFISQYVAKTPTAPTDPVSLGYFNTYVIKTTSGKSIIICGDSITATNDRTNWPTFALPLLGISDNGNYAYSGAHWENFAGFVGLQQMSDQVAAAIASGVTPDIVVVAMGTNSFIPTKFGSYDATMAKALVDLDINNVMDACRKNLYDLANAYPNARLFYGTPIQRASMDVDTERGYVDQYVKMAKNYNYTIIDAFNEVGIQREFEVSGAAGRWLVDGLHPGTPGKELMGKFYAKRIETEYFK